MWFVNRIVNPVVMAILRSPAHRILSGRLVVLHLTGRRSGRRFALPVLFRRDGDTLTVSVALPERKRWWRNVTEQTPVDVLIDGGRRHGLAERRTAPDGSVTVRIDLS